MTGINSIDWCYLKLKHKAHLQNILKLIHKVVIIIVKVHIKKQKNEMNK